jgi:hypothetical protein
MVATNYGSFISERNESNILPEDQPNKIQAFLRKPYLVMVWKISVQP